MAKKVEPIVEEISTAVKVFKKCNDALISFCGETMKVEDGREYFELSASAKEFVEQHLNLIWPEEA